MERLVRICAPRGVVDFIGKAGLFLLAIGLMNYLRDFVLEDGTRATLSDSILDGAFVGLPFVVLSLALVRHQYTLQRKLAELAATDMLTGLPNRRGFLDKVAAGGRIDRAGLLLLVDVDHFKKVNDTYGHAVGDICLQAVARHLRSHTRPGDGVARYGGEEFVVFLPGAGQDRLEEMARALTSGVLVRAHEEDAEEVMLTVTMSVGAALIGAGAVVDAALTRADEALYRAKGSGRARMMLSPVAA